MTKKKEVKKKKVAAEPVVYLRKYRCMNCGEVYEKDSTVQDKEVCPVCNGKSLRIG